jgi:IPT/TIG domain
MLPPREVPELCFVHPESVSRVSAFSRQATTTMMTPAFAIVIERNAGMTTRNRASALATAGLALFTCACDGQNPSTTLSAPTPVSHGVATPTVAAISPNVGSTSGDTPVVISGTGFLRGVTATLGSVAVNVRFDTRYTDRIFLSTPPHAAGTVGVVVTNPGGQPGRLDAGYTYAVPASFDFNGTWWGFPLDGSDLPLEFTIQNNALLTASCDTSVVTFSPPVPVTNGAFSFSQDGSTMTGKIVSASQAIGAIALAPCNAPLWDATRKP